MRCRDIEVGHRSDCIYRVLEIVRQPLAARVIAGQTRDPLSRGR